jgi:hypothetical protein
MTETGMMSGAGSEERGQWGRLLGDGEGARELRLILVKDEGVSE